MRQEEQYQEGRRQEHRHGHTNLARLQTRAKAHQDDTARDLHRTDDGDTREDGRRLHAPGGQQRHELEDEGRLRGIVGRKPEGQPHKDPSAQDSAHLVRRGARRPVALLGDGTRLCQGQTGHGVGRHTARFSPPRTRSVFRQPSAPMRSCVSGIKTVLANPPTSVSAVMPRRASGPKTAVMTANAGSYNTPAILVPISTQIA